MLKVLISVAMLASCAPVMAQAPMEKTIVVDMREDCGIGRVAEFYKAKAMSRAREKQRELKAEGYKVKVVKLLPGTVLATTPHHLTMNPAC